MSKMTWRCEGAAGTCGHCATWRVGIEGEELRYLCSMCAAEGGHVVPLFGVRALPADLDDIEMELLARRREQDGMGDAMQYEPEDVVMQYEKKNAEMTSAISQMHHDHMKALMEQLTGATIKASSPPIMVSPDTFRDFQRAAKEFGVLDPRVSPPLPPDPRAGVPALRKPALRCPFCGDLPHVNSACPVGPPF